MTAARVGVTGPFTVKVVGVTFAPGYPDNLAALDLAAAQAFLTPQTWKEGAEPLPAVLVRNPGNEHDANAIEVHVPALGDQGMVGHLPASLAARVAPQMDAGQAWAAEVVSVLVHPDHPDRPGVDLRCWRPK